MSTVPDRQPTREGTQVPLDGARTDTDRGVTDRGVTGRTTFLTNIPNPHNGYLYEELRRLGDDVEVRYKGLPSSEGRPWDLRPAGHDRVAPTLWHERQAFGRGDPAERRARRSLILSGSWATPRDAARRAAALWCHRSGTRTLVWGEPMSDKRGLRHLARQAYFSPVGLDAVLGIGTHAVDSYRVATRQRVPVHVFPYTTSSGLDVPPQRAAQPVVGFTGRLIPYKGVDLAIRAMSAIPVDARPRLDIVGSGPLGGELRELARTLRVDATFHGEVSPADLTRIRSRWWLCLVPSREVEGWGLVVPEALNSGVPVVASAYVGAGLDLVRDGLNGALIETGATADPDAWADAVTRLLADDLDGLAVRARAVGAAFSPAPAARWLHQLLASDLTAERSFITDGWARLRLG